MKLYKDINALDQELVDQRLKDFVPPRIYDIHAHLFSPMKQLAPYLREEYVGWKEYLAMTKRWLPEQTINGLFFGFPAANNDRAAINQWLAKEIVLEGVEKLNRALVLVSPADDQKEVARLLADPRFVGLKPYHCYAPMSDTSQAEIEEFTPEWMWEACAERQGILMLHIMRDGASADPKNIAALRRLCRRYPRCQVILAHLGRSFSYRTAREGLKQLDDVENLWLDTSAVTEAETFRYALEIFGPKRILFGTDCPVSQLRGRCVATGREAFAWFFAPESDVRAQDHAGDKMTLIGIESVLCLREAAEDNGLGKSEIEDIFLNNALRILSPHLGKENLLPKISGPELWSEAKTKVSGGTGLRSKWAELYDPKTWPSYFSRCSGCEVWDLNGRRYLDFGSGVGAVMLGYSDPDVNRAVKHRIDAGSYCQLVAPEEPELADLLLELNPWAGRVRYARGGGEAMMMAVRVARAATGKTGVAFCGYHGWHDWYLAANLADKSSLDGHLLPGLQPLGVPRELSGTSVPFRFNDWPSFESALNRLDGKLAAVVMEPMRTQFPQDKFLEKVAQQCRSRGAVFVLDEVSSGWRFGFPGAHTTLKIEPDIAVYAKAMSNGFPCAAVVGRANIMELSDPSFISSSYWTDGVGPTAALACIRKMRAVGAQARVWELGGKMQAGLSQLAARHTELKMKSSGLPSNPGMIFELGENALHVKTLIVRKMLARGFLTTGGALFIMFSHTEEIIGQYLEALDLVLADISQIASAGQLKTAAGAPNATGQFARLT